MFDEDYDGFKCYPENPRIKLLRFDKSAGITPPYRATPRFFFPNLNPHPNKTNPSPLRNIILSDLPSDAAGRSDSGYENLGEEKLMKKKAMSFGETIQVLEIDPESAVEEQPWAHYPKACHVQGLGRPV
jgi:hypothetical protein